MPRLPPRPEIDWSNADAPRAIAFDDIYFSREGGLAESEAVFLAGCGLPEVWRDKRRFAVCELGFGAGVNVLALWRAWRRTRLPHAQLHISTIEAFPLERTDAARALAQFPEVADLAARLLECWPVRAYAPQRLWFAEDGFSLTVHTGEAETILAGLDGAFDAWFLDGFAPARSARMWNEGIFRNVARLSASNARAATFTVAGEVRRGLESAGFAVEKKPGFGSKRERLEARRTGAASPLVSPPKRVAILGAGIAGASTARALARRDVETVVVDAAVALGGGASGNPAGLIMPRLDREGPLREMFLAAYLEAVRLYEAIGQDVFAACGVEQRPGARNAEALADLLHDPPLPDDWMRPLPNGAVLHARAGVVRPLAVLRAFLRDANVMLDAPVAAIERSNAAWKLRTPDGRALLKADAVVLACGAALTQFGAAKFLPIELSRGQIEWGSGLPPARAVAQSNYFAPFDGGVLFGATFDKYEQPETHGERAGRAFEAQSDAASRMRNLEALAKLAPDVAASIDPAMLNSRASLRAATPDRAPLAGALPDVDAWRAQGAATALDATPPSPRLPGVYVLGGLGARGFTLAPLLGECVADEICAAPPMLSKEARASIDPERFLRRLLKRRP
ncbi:MAG: FAD-dependent 5-carboxymethylaminomethyl-2-thiouridine(34) oxidoreductase MnmC [Proteobacteria bacterium]|nr:FAD-dependent 5-carboxymethylaminomethyl-2-thiouridine(34) oxidoreductase MnmC [Pseudomonadota bacterium]